MEWAFLIYTIAITALCVLSNRAAYCNGVTDGYGYSKEPRCLGYAAAGKYLREVMAHRWPELRDGTTECHGEGASTRTENRAVPKGGSGTAPPKGEGRKQQNDCGCDTMPGWRCQVHGDP